MKNKYISAMEAGKEIVIIAKDETFNSAVFWLKENQLWTFSRALGSFPREFTPAMRKTITAHFKAMETGGDMIFIRG